MDETLDDDCGTAERFRQVAPDDDEREGRRMHASLLSRLFGDPYRPSRIGRFVMLEHIGHGGMGRVYAAYDEELDRKVAIKMLLDDELPTQAERTRFLREARALGRLSHPNVVTVHEVGESDGRIFVAMEYVQGESLRDWLGTEPDWSQVLEVFVQAGQGLVAAHRAELIHRDIKPANIMRRDDGVVKVLDFGIVRMATNRLTASMDAAPVVGSSSLSTETSSLTRTGAVMGTPAYMAPEQHQGDVVDERSDQYGFCIALWEGLTGSRPFVADDGDSMLEAKRSGPPPWPSEAPAVPRVVVEALRRGLSAEPDERWPSMDELLEALSWDPRRRRHRWVSGLAGGLALGLGGMALWGWADDRPQQCTGAAARIGEVWSDARRADVEAAIVGTGKSYAVGVWDRVEPQLEQYADGWAQMYTEACEATTVRAEQSDRMMDLRMACLDRALVDLGAAVETLSGADAELVRKAHEVTAGMRPLSWCADTEALDAELDPPRPQEAEAVKEARQQLARAESLLRGGRYADAQSVLELAEAELAGVEYGPARMELALTKGRVLGALGDYDASEVALTEALRLASQWQERRPLADALRAMMTVVGRYQQRTDDALRYWPLLEGVSLYDPMEHAEAREIRATILRSKGELEEAEAEHRAVLSMREEVLGADHPDVASTRNSLANVLNAQGKYEEAVAEHRRALAVAHRALGPDHPTVARYRNSLANALWKLGELEEAESEHRAALASKLEALGPNHPSVTTSRQNLASILITRGKLDEAELEARAALRSGEESRGAAHPETARARSNLAVLLIKQGKLEEAEAETRAALAAQQQARGPDHEDVAAVQANLAAILLDQGKLEEGEAEARAAIAVMERVLGADHPSLFYPRTLVANALESGGKLDEAEAEYRGVLALLEGSVGSEHPDMARARASLAKLLVLRQRAADALPLAEQAWAQYQRDDAVPEDRAETAFVLARALWEVDGPLRDRARARQLADDALESFREAGRAFDGFAREVQQWLDDHQRP